MDSSSYRTKCNTECLQTSQRQGRAEGEIVVDMDRNLIPPTIRRHPEFYSVEIKATRQKKEQSKPKYGAFGRSAMRSGGQDESFHVGLRHL